MDKKPKIHFYGGAAEIDGSCYLVEFGDEKILIDCGLHQGGETRKLNVEPFPFDAKDIKVVFATHSHVDHIGKFPLLYKRGFRGKYISTPPTKELAEMILYDSQRIISSYDEKNPLYAVEDVREALNIWETYEYHKEVNISPDISFTFYNAGHILGSASIVIKFKINEEKDIKVVFSGDLGNKGNMLLPEYEPLSEGDYYLIESTYGDRFHENLDTRKDRFEDVIEDVAKKGGVLMIPSFALERTQELLFELNELVQNGRIPEMPIFVDSPLAIKLTEIHKEYLSYFSFNAFKMVKDDIDGFFSFPGLKFTLSVDESKAINNVSTPKIIVAGSGSSHGGRILHHEKRYLSDPKNTILMVGYQMANTLGRKILEGEKVVKIHGEKIDVNARVVYIGAYSAHADQTQLLDWIKPARFTIKKLFVVHGDNEASETLADKARDEFGINTIIPDYNDVFELD